MLLAAIDSDLKRAWRIQLTLPDHKISSDQIECQRFKMMMHDDIELSIGYNL